MADEAPKDLGSPEHPSVSWKEGEALNSLQALFARIAKDADDAINWYLWARKPKRLWATRLRVGAILAGAVAGIIPMVSQIYTQDGKPIIQPAWASIALAAAAALVVLDRFFGFSSAWMRYIATELSIRQIASEFQLDWEADRARWQGAEPDQNQIQTTLARFKAFVSQINTIIRQETDAWIQEFQSTLTQIDEAAKAKAAIAELGAVNVVVSNGDACENGWNLIIDGGGDRNYRGKTAGVGNLVPGTHIIKVDGTIAGNRKQAEAAVTVAAGGSANVQLILS